MGSRFNPKSLTAQMIGRLVLLVVITAVIAGLPGILVVRHELDAQAWSRVEQASNNMETLYTARQNELIAFAKLIAHRTCLQEQVKEKDQAGALGHLHDLVQGTEIELVVLCDVDGQFIASTLDLPVEGLCKDVKERGFALIPVERSSGKLSSIDSNVSDTAYQVWVTGAHNISDQESQLGWTIAGIPANDALADVVHFQNGLEYSILYNNQLVMTSFEDELITPGQLIASATEETAQDGELRRTFQLNNQNFFAIRQRLEANPELDYEVALSIADILATQQQMIWSLAGSIVVVILFGSTVGIFMSRRITRPLNQLTDTAITFRGGNLGSPVNLDSDLWEVRLVAKAIEDARIKLLQSLTELRKERAWTNHLIESIVEGIITLDPENRITFFSHGAERITGWNRDDVVGEPIDAIFNLPENNKLFHQFIPPNMKESKVVVELTGGRTATLSITGALLAQPEAEGAETALVFRDVTDEEIIHRRLGDFMANITHEFRTPLSSLAASIELLQDQTPLIEPKDLDELLNSLHLGILRLQTMIDNLIESASIEAGHFHVSPRFTDFGRITQEAKELINPLLGKYDQRLVIQLPEEMPQVWADSRRTVQVLVNLLSNANKFGPADSDIYLKAETVDGYLFVRVIDSGPGIPVEERGYIFRRFKHHGQDRVDPKAGSGLGLSVVKAIVEAQEGQTGIEDCPQGGTQFWFTLKTRVD